MNLGQDRLEVWKNTTITIQKDCHTTDNQKQSCRKERGGEVSRRDQGTGKAEH